MKKIIMTKEAPGAIGPYSQGVLANGFIFTAGQLPVDPDMGTVPEGIKAQTERSLLNLKAVLKAAGADIADVVKVTVFLKDMNDFVAMNEIYSIFFKSECPARSAVEVARLPKDVVVEIEAIATVA